ncbi:unnamed protein product, partial [Choristocarpus tenellus]
MEENPTPVLSAGRRKSLITNMDGVVTGEEITMGLGRTESGMVLDRIVLCEVPNLGAKFTPSMFPNKEITVNTQGEPTHYNKLLGDRDCIIY